MPEQQRSKQIINDEWAWVIQSGAAICVATHDSAMRPHLTRAWAGQLSKDRSELSVFLPISHANQSLTDLGICPDVAVVIGRPSNYISVQVKGLLLGLGEPTAEDISYIDRYWKEFLNEMDQAGFPPEQGLLLRGGDLIRLTISVVSIFTQTPGDGAGEEIKT